MQYFKNVDLAKLHSVSEGTVRRWIEATRQGKLDLQLYEANGKHHIANITKNTQIIKALVDRGKKHANTRWHKLLTPSDRFYQLYSKRQIVDLITSIDIHHELPMQYNYFGEGAGVWDKYADRLINEDEQNALTAVVQLLQTNFENIDRLLEGYTRVNVIDIGVGNGLPVKELLTHFLYDTNTLGRYIGIDISQKMLDITAQNVKKWFDGRVSFEGYVRDISYERFDDLLIDEDPETAANIVLVLGGTIENFRVPEEVLQVIHHSLGRNSLFFTSRKPDSEVSRRFFDFHTDASLPKLPSYHRLMLENLNLDESLYEVHQGFDKEKLMRFICIKPTIDLTIKFQVGDKERFVDISKGQEILLWRAWHHSTLEIINLLNKCGFNFVNSSTTRDQEFLLTTSQIKLDAHN